GHLRGRGAGWGVRHRPRRLMTDASKPLPAPEEIPDALDGQRVDRVVALITGCSRAEASALVAAEQVLVDEEVVTKPSLRLHTAQVVRLLSEPSRPIETVEPDPAVEIRVVAEDDEFLVVDKPAGLVVHPGAGHKGSTMVHGLIARYPE